MKKPTQTNYTPAEIDNDDLRAVRGGEDRTASTGYHCEPDLRPRLDQPEGDFWDAAIATLERAKSGGTAS